MSAMIPVLYGLTLLPYAFFFGLHVYLFIAPCYGKLSGHAFIEFFQAIDPYMKVWAKRFHLAGLVLMMPVLLLTSGVPFVLTLGALSASLVMLVIAVMGNVPLNRAMVIWSPQEPPPGWERVRDRWLRYHSLRGVAAVMCFVLLLTAALSDRPASPSHSRVMDGSPVPRRWEATVYLPLTDNEGRSFAAERWDAALAELVRAFGGATLGDPQEGCWVDDHGRFIREPVRPIVVSFAPERLREFRRVSQIVGQRLGQQAVYVRYEEPHVDLIPAAEGGTRRP